jgi:hypothetical protein
MAEQAKLQTLIEPRVFAEQVESLIRMRVCIEDTEIVIVIRVYHLEIQGRI